MKNKKIILSICAAAMVAYTLVMLLVVYRGDKAPKNYTEAKDGVVWVVSQYGEYYSAGSGFAIGEAGKPIQYIVTNYHVVFNSDTGRKADSVNVFFSAAANRYMSAQIYSYSADKDLAVLKLPEPTTERKALKLRKMKDTDTSATYYALGYPAIADVGVDYTKYDVSDIVTTSGIISRQSTVGEVEAYLLDIDINHGNSGGPLVSAKGEVVGINTFSMNSSDGTANYAVCIDELLRIVEPEYVDYMVVGDINKRGVIVIALTIAVDAAIVAFALAVALGKRGAKAAAAGGGYATQNSNIGYTVAAGTPAIVIKGISGSHRGEEFELQGSLVFGRDSKNCNVVFPVDAQGVSGCHCRLSLRGNKVYIRDIGSSYGTFINDDVRADKNTDMEIRVGDTFSLGSEKEKFLIGLKG